MDEQSYTESLDEPTESNADEARRICGEAWGGAAIAYCPQNASSNVAITENHW
jgi:hypothetical protein